MAGINKVILVGNLGQDPEIRTFQNGGRIANLSLATSETWKDKATGEKKERTQWHRIVVNVDGLVGICEKYIKKGSKLYIEGQLETRKYTDKDGTEKYTTEVVLRAFNSKIEMLDTRGSNNNSGHASAPAEQSGSFAQSSGADMDDEIPF